jgi:Dynein heavy chain, N-terminal region 1
VFIVWQAIPAVLPSILTRMRVIWNVSAYYKAPDKMLQLLKKLSNEVMNRCSSAISLDRILAGDVETEQVLLKQVRQQCYPTSTHVSGVRPRHLS